MYHQGSFLHQMKTKMQMRYSVPFGDCVAALASLGQSFPTVLTEMAFSFLTWEMCLSIKFSSKQKCKRQGGIQKCCSKVHAFRKTHFPLFVG